MDLVLFCVVFFVLSRSFSRSFSRSLCSLLFSFSFSLSFSFSSSFLFSFLFFFLFSFSFSFLFCLLFSSRSLLSFLILLVLCLVLSRFFLRSGVSFPSLARRARFVLFLSLSVPCFSHVGADFFPPCSLSVSFLFLFSCFTPCVFRGLVSCLGYYSLGIIIDSRCLFAYCVFIV